MQRQLEGCVALVTGAGSGIGRAAGPPGRRAAGREGAKIAALDFDADSVRSAVQEVVAVTRLRRAPGNSSPRAP